MSTLFNLLQTEDRPMHAGEIAMRLQIPTHEAISVLDTAARCCQVRFIELHGWVLTDTFTPAFPAPDGQQFLPA